MSNDTGAHIDAALEALDVDQLYGLLRDMVGIRSATGHEKDLAEFLAHFLNENGIDAYTQPISDTQYNVIGHLRGSGDGAALLFNGHLDTSYTGLESHLKGAGYKPALTPIGEWLYGLGIYNMKSGLAAAIAAVLAVRRSGIPLAGDLIIGGAAGEVEKAPVEEFQGADFAGYGTGTSYMVKHGVVADVGIVCEPTDFKIATGHFGAVWLRLTIYGDTSHTVYTTRGGLVHAIEQLPKVIDALVDWRRKYQEKYSYKGYVPAVNIASVRGGQPWRAARTPSSCTLYIDVRTTPGLTGMDVRREIAGVMRALAQEDPTVRWSLDTYLVAPPVQIPEDEPIIEYVARAHRQMTGTDAERLFRPPIDDSGHLNAAGIPTVSYGLGPLRNLNVAAPGEEPGERVRFDDVVRLARTYTMLAVEVTSQPPERVRRAFRQEAHRS